MNLLPRDEKFFDYFLRQASIVRDASQAFRSALESREGIPEMAALLRELEYRGDEIEHEIYLRLHKTFITPIDPEDVHALASGLDDILDAFESAAYRVAAFGLTSPPEALIALARTLDEAAQISCRVFEELDRTGLEKKEFIGAQAVELNRLEWKCEEIAREAITRVFAEEKDCIALLRAKEIYEYCEAIGDRFEALANNLENITAKNS
jgi:predicted phosphate transport protein (TIGR00153 family)